MEHPTRRPDETWKHFRRRARHAFTAHLHFMESSRRRLIPEVLRGRELGGTRRKKRDELEHYRWAVLRQCCGWELKRIAVAPRGFRKDVDTSHSVQKSYSTWVTSDADCRNLSTDCLLRPTNPLGISGNAPAVLTLLCRTQRMYSALQWREFALRVRGSVP